ncbi:CidA/LrgA family protein [Devosia rhizoryzae]|uniref:CidA/LrgA family protein n=1 Tax=Devosia rhizoryzae TaxID=2774137 RepID=A0ABX7C8Y5_9HYPH|nr:CidA/LrgA family protein [Devosia rhizoryzae]QQR40728.1 CidA/LrgA family protein [Devosia rhizoryzae]
MLLGLFALLACQLAGEVIVRAFAWPVPGPVIGIVLMFAVLTLHGHLRKPEAAEQGPIAKVADTLLANLGLVFVPAGVGISQHHSLILDHGLALIVALVVSTVMTLLVTVGVFRLVSRLQSSRRALP